MTYCREEWEGHWECMSIRICVSHCENSPPASILLFTYCFHRIFHSVLKPLAPFHALSPRFRCFIRLLISCDSPPPPSLQPWLRLHLWLTTNSLTCRLQHSCPNHPPTPASEKQTHPAGDYLHICWSCILYITRCLNLFWNKLLVWGLMGLTPQLKVVKCLAVDG